jgi:hypothetical protein
MPTRRPLASPRPVTPAEAISSSSASWVPDPDPRSGYGSGMPPPPAPAYPGPAAAAPGMDWLRSPVAYVAAGVLVLGLGIAIAFLLRGGSSKPSVGAAPENATARQRQTIVLPQAPDSATAAPVSPSAAQTPPPAAEPHAAPSVRNGTPINVLSMVDVNRDTVEGGWTRQPDGSLTCDGTSRFNHIVLPYQPPGEYDLSATFTITGTVGDDAVMLIFTNRHNMCTWIVNSWKQGAAGFNLIDHKTGPNNPTFAPDHPIQKGERHILMVKVRKAYIEGWLDGKMLSHYNTNGSDLTMNPGWHLNGNQIGLGAMCPTTFHAAEVVEVHGHGKAEFVSKR